MAQLLGLYYSMALRIGMVGVGNISLSILSRG